jgi:hypothetical protein
MVCKAPVHWAFSVPMRSLSVNLTKSQELQLSAGWAPLESAAHFQSDGMFLQQAGNL